MIRRNTRKAPTKRKNGAATLTEIAADTAYRAGSDAWRTRQPGYNVDEAAANWLAFFGPLDRVERMSVESAFIRGWKEAATKAPAKKAPAKRKNGAKTVADPVAARELELYIENESALVAAANSMGRAIMRNLAGMIARNTYDSTKAWKAWMPLADEGAKRYTREYGDRFGTTFNKATREMVANALAEAFESEVRTGAIDLAALLAPRANPRTRKNTRKSAERLTPAEALAFAREVTNWRAPAHTIEYDSTAPPRYIVTFYATGADKHAGRDPIDRITVAAHTRANPRTRANPAADVRAVLRGWKARGLITTGEYNDGLYEITKGRGEAYIARLRRSIAG